MNGITFKQLRYFEALAKHGHFGRAAEVVSISQPALSMQIKELEDTLGAALFERSARSVRLSRLGRDFAPRVREILRAVDELGDMARSAHGQFVGRLGLGVIPTIAPYLLPAVIRQLGADYPDLDVHVRETLTDRLVADLSDGRIDCAIVALPLDELALTEHVLFEEEFVFVRPDTQAGEPAPRHSDLSTMRMLLLEEGHCFRDQALSFCQLSSAQQRDGLDGSSLSTLVQMVGVGIGVTMLPQMAVPVETRMAAVDVVRFDGSSPRRSVGMVWRRTNPLADQFVDLARSVQAAAVRQVAS